MMRFLSITEQQRFRRRRVLLLTLMTFAALC